MKILNFFVTIFLTFQVIDASDECQIKCMTMRGRHVCYQTCPQPQYQPSEDLYR